MELTVFAKKRTTSEGKPFYTYLTQLIRKEDKKPVSAQVKFPEGFVPKPADCPMNIVVEKKNANLSVKEIQTENGTVVSRTLWIKDYKLSNNEFVDNSLDDYE